MPDRKLALAERRARDAEWVRLISTGDESAIRSVYNEYSGIVYSLARRILVSDADAEEILQDVFVELWKRAREFDPTRGSLAGYLIILTRTSSIDRLRHRRARPAAGVEPAPREAFSTAPIPLEFATIEESRARVIASLQLIPAEERRVLELAYFEGLSQSEIAERTGWPLGTVKGRARNGMRRLRETLPVEFGGEKEI